MDTAVAPPIDRHRRRLLQRLLALGAAGATGCGGGASLTLPPSTVTAEGVTLTPLAGTPQWAAATHGKLSKSLLGSSIATVFAPGSLHRIELVIERANWQLMQSDFAALKARRSAGAAFRTLPDPVTVPGSVRYRGVEWYKVGIRFKGNSSLYSANNGKLPFKLDFDEFEDEYPAIDGQRFHGFKKLHLKNNFRDETQLHELLADDLFRDFGLASPHAAFVQLAVDSGDGSGPRAFGLYTLVEDVEDTVLKLQFADDSGNLYKPEDDAARFAEGSFDPAELALKTNQDGATYADARALYTAINDRARFEGDRASWKAALEASFDVPRFLKWLAANTVMQNWDSYGSMPHNYYLYGNARNAGRLEWIPWDHNEALATHPRALPLAMTGVDSGWPLIHYLVRDSSYLALYKAEVAAFARDHFDPAVLGATVQAHAALVRDAVAAEPAGYSFTSASRFTAAVTALQAHIASRRQAALAYAAS